MKAKPRYAIAADRIFDGDTVRRDCAVIVEGAHITAVMARDETPDDLPLRIVDSGLWLAPGFIDVQVNGGGDVLFNNSPTRDGISAIRGAHRKGGTTAMLPTLVTDSDEKMRLARAAVDAAMCVDAGVLGIHFEGPFLSAEKAGVHDPHLMRAPSEGHLSLLTQSQGVTLVTLAPECVPRGFIAGLARAGARVSLGHSMATYSETREAIAEGLRGFTHLFNAMRPMTAREPGPIAAALESSACWHGLIVDGEHVAPAMLKLAVRSEGRSMLVTDAMPPVHGRATGFTLQNRIVEVAGGRATMDGRLAGSVLDMAGAVRNAVRLLEVPLPDALGMASRAPAEFLGLGQWLGRLAKGYRADMIAFDPSDIRIVETWVAGQGAEAHE